jgi:hypothetical protein
MAAQPLTGPEPVPTLELSPDVTFARLPFGGGVLVNATTLAIAECDQRHRELVDAALAGDRTAISTRLAARLVKDGWLVIRTEREDPPV